jgi:DNA-binding NtrC family response regulator
MIATAMADFGVATEIDQEFGPIAEGKRTVAAQWYKLARAAYLVSSNRPAEALGQWRSCVGEASAIGDRNYLDRFALVAAEAHLLEGEAPQGVEAVASVSLGPQGHLPEFSALAQRVSGRLATDSRFAAFDHFARAARVFGHIGHLVGRGESLHNTATLRATLAGNDPATVPHITTFYSEPPSSFGRVDASAAPPTSADAVAQALRATAAMVDLTSRPALSGYELLSLVAASGASASAVMVARRGSSHDVLGWIGTDDPDTTVLADSEPRVTFALGSDGARDVSVVVRPRNQGSARTTLLALQRLALNAATLHQAAVAESERSALWPEPLPEQQLGFVCASESMLQLLTATRRVAASNFPVLITGETGTGKELLARAIHNSSPRSKQRFQPFNCTAVAREMLDAQLFGYKRGAFTGAHDSFLGVIRSAAGGTLLLDEIGEIGLDVQPKLLRFLESNEVHPLGEPAPVSVDVRVVAATNANLDALVEQGKFRDDLFYRLNVVRLTIPPLRERREEIPLLLDHFLERAQKECGKSGIRVGETAAEYLLLYAWPGNVRELANEVRRAVALAEPGAVLMPEHLSAKLAATRRTVPVAQRPPDHAELVVRRDQPLTAAVEHVERALIQDALHRHANVEDAARALGLSRKGLYLKRQRLKIDE